MRNLKKYLSVLLVVAIMATAMVPVFAAETYTYSAEAQKLNTLGLYSGISATTFDPDLGTALDRETGVVMLLRIFGLEATANAMSDADAAAALAAYTDAKDVSAWALKSVAYAVKNGLVAGTTTTTIGPKAALSGEMYATLVLRQLGYTVGLNDYSNATYILADKGGLKITEAIKFDNKDLVKDDLVGITFGALNAKYSTGTTVLADLMADGVVTVEKAVYAGVYTAPATPTPTVTPTPVPFGVDSITALNTKQVQVVFNQEVDKTTANTATNYTVGGVAFGTAVRQADNKTVILTLAGETAMTNAGTPEIKVLKAIKNAAGTAMSADYAKKITVTDTKVPEIVSVAATGLKTIKVTFDEPVYDAAGNTTLENDQVTVKSGIYSYTVTGVEADYANKTITITVGTNLIEGEVLVTFNAPGMADAQSIRDFAGLTLLKQDKTFTYAPDNTVATATLSSVVKETKKATVTFSKAVYGTNVKLYHSVNGTDAYATAVVTKAQAAAATSWEFTFTNALPSGNLTFYLVNSSTASEQLTDLYGIKVPNQTFTYDVTADTVAPTVSSVTANTNVSFTIVYSEDVDATEKVKADNYEILKPDGTKLSFTTESVDAKTVKLNATLVDNTTYTVNVKAMKDAAGNAMAAAYSVQKTVSDNGNPTATAYFTANNTIYVVYSEDMAEADITSKLNYLVDADSNGTYTALGTNDTITLISPKKVKITWAAADLDVTAPYTSDVKIGAVRDIAGKKLVGDDKFETILADVASDALSLTTAQLTAVNKVKLKFNKELGAFDNTQFEIRQTTDGATAEAYNIQSVESNTVNSDGVSEVVVVLDRNFRPDAKDSTDIAVEVFTKLGNDGTKSVEATKLTAGDQITVADKVAPSIKYVVYQSATSILVRFDEILDSASFAGAGKNGFSVSGGTLTTALIDGGVDSTDVIFTGTSFTIDTDVTYTAGNVTDDAGKVALASVTKTDAMVRLIATDASTPDATVTITVDNYSETFTAAAATNLFDGAGVEIVGGATIGDFKFEAAGFAEVGVDQLTVAITTGGVATFAFTDGGAATGDITGTVTITNVKTGAKDVVNVAISAADAVVVTE